MRKSLINEIKKEKPNSSALGGFSESLSRYSGYMQQGEKGQSIVKTAIKDFSENLQAYKTIEKTKGLTNTQKRFQTNFKSALAGAKKAYSKKLVINNK